MTTTLTAPTSTEAKVLELLSAGIEPEHVASAVGLTPGRISQIVSNPEFAAKLAELKFESLRKHNATDNEYDALEKMLLEKLKQCAGLLFDPMKIARILQTVNSAKRRGASAPDSIVRQKQTIRLNINAAVVTKFAVNGANQVVQASVGDESQDLVTIQSSGVQRLLNEHTKTVAQIEATEGKREIDGVRWQKSQGREKHDLLTECGFAHAIEVSIEQEGSRA